MRILITGITGFSGRALLSYIREHEPGSHEIFGLVRREAGGDQEGYTPVHGDLSNRSHISDIITHVAPDLIFHLAGRNQGPLPDLLDGNVCNTENLLCAVKASGLMPRIIAAGSAAEYGNQGEEPIPEDAPVSPVSIYGISKAAQTAITSYYCRKEYFPLSLVRIFNLVGPGQTSEYLCGNIVHQMVARIQGSRDCILLQGSDSSRDYLDVRDAVRAYWMIAREPWELHGPHAIWNVGSGQSYSVREIVTIVEEIAGASANLVLAGELPDFIPYQRGDISRIQEQIGWTPAIPLRSSLKEMLSCAIRES